MARSCRYRQTGSQGSRVRDEHVRPGTVESLAGLKPAFQKDGIVTPGNASGLNDGAAAMVLTSAEAEKWPESRAWLVGYAFAGVDPEARA